MVEEVVSASTVLLGVSILREESWQSLSGSDVISRKDER